MPSLVSRYGWMGIVAVFCLGVAVQSVGVLNPDVSWAMHVAERLLQGGHYYVDFFENNPPLIFYLSMLPVLLAGMSKLGFVFSVRVTIFSLILVSLCLCARLLQRIFPAQHKGVRYLLLLTLTYVFAVQPGFYWGEREHLACILCMPYLLVIVLRAEAQSISLPMALITGLMAGLGFATKPFFVIPFFVVEGYLMVKQRKWTAWWRPESALVAALVLGYVISILIFTPEYIVQMIPYAAYLYGPYYHDYASWLQLLLHPAALYCYAAVAIYVFIARRQLIEHRELGNIIALAAIGFLLSYACQLLVIEYHVLPMLGLSTLLMVFVGCQLVVAYPGLKKGYECVFMMMAWVFLLWMPIAESLHWLSIGQRWRNDVSYHHLIQYARQHAMHQPVYFFTTNLGLVYPLADYARVNVPSRFPGFWILPGLFLEADKRDVHNETSILQRKQFLIETVTAELERYSPHYVFISPQITWRFVEGNTFDYIRFFSHNAKFRAIWKKYHYVTRFGDVQVYSDIG